jgi:hypothetical protein
MSEVPGGTSGPPFSVSADSPTKVKSDLPTNFQNRFSQPSQNDIVNVPVRQ